MLHRPFGIPTTTSILLCVATCALWVRSYWVQDVVGWCRTDPADPSRLITYNVTVIQGTIGLNSMSGPTAVLNSVSPGPFHRTVAAEPESRAENAEGGFLSRAGFEHGRVEIRWLRVTIEGGSVPIWLPATVAGLLPLLGVTRSIRRRLRTRSNFCSACGYDLRATPDRCPECGAVPSGGT